MADKVLILTVLMIFFAALVGMVLRYRRRDKCLQWLEGYFVILEWPGGKQAWGTLGVFHNAVELAYPTPHPSTGGHHETSYILYKPNFKDLYAFKRFHDELSEKNQGRRKKEIRRTYRPNVIRRTRRRAANVFNLMRDAVAQALGVFIGQAKKTTGSMLIQTQDARLTDTATQLLTGTAAAYEPILEKYIGRKVVLELAHDSAVRDFCGILKEYTEEFISLLDILVEEEFQFDLSQPEQLQINHHLDFEVEPGSGGGDTPGPLRVKVTNRGNHNVTLCRATVEAYERRLDIELPPGGSSQVLLDDLPAKDPGKAGNGGATPPACRLHIRTVRTMDMVAPRARAVVRHAAEIVTPTRFRLT
jgi:hypothetical protein